MVRHVWWVRSTKRAIREENFILCWALILKSSQVWKLKKVRLYNWKKIYEKIHVESKLQTTFGIPLQQMGKQKCRVRLHVHFRTTKHLPFILRFHLSKNFYFPINVVIASMRATLLNFYCAPQYTKMSFHYTP